MKVYIWPLFGKETGQGGIKRVYEALHKHLPSFGVDIVNTVDKADLVNVHADEYPTDLPVAASLHGLYWNDHEWPSWCYEANSRLIRVAKRAQSVSVPSKWVHHSFARGMLLDPFVLMHGVDIEEWDPLPSAGYVLWAKNRPDPICDPKQVTQLAKLAPNQQFITTFGGEDLPNVSRLGKIEFSHLKPYIQQAGVYLGTVQETGGITCLEAMACGVPVLGFAWGANSELVIHKETGYLVEPGDYEALREGLEYCQANRDRLGFAARQLVIEKFQWKDRIGAYIPFYEAALQETKYPVKVSVIVTAHNLDGYLPACLESILNQSFDDWECIVIDDASPDRCGEIADGYAERSSKFRVVHNTQNRYLAQARNIGLQLARGKYILALDADDALSVNALDLLAGQLDALPDVDIATGSFELVEPDGKHWQSGWPSSHPGYDQQIQKRNQVPYASMVRKKIWDRVGGYRRRYRTTEDAENWTRMMSYGAVPAKVTDAVTLIYANRPNSMSHTIAAPDWTAWFPWSKYPELTPFGASAGSENRFYARNVHTYGPPKISVVIPCGPGHDFYLQDALDSLVAQTFLEWEAIVVNDTGKRWYSEDGKLINPYLRGFPFVKFISDEDGKQHGVSWARNRGVMESTAPVFVLIDADDYMQPLMLDALYRVYQEYGGWVYSDWYDQDGAIKHALSWDADILLAKMLGPSTGLYRKEDWNQVEGFDENAPGWEDWIFQLALLENGVCGSRVDRPLFTYRYQTGARREENFSRQKEILQYIDKTFQNLKDGGIMACRSCGGGGGQSSVAVGFSTSQSEQETVPMQLLEYVGAPIQMRTIRSRVSPRRSYRFGGEKGSSSRKFFVYMGDVEWITAMQDFKKIDSPDISLSVRQSPVQLEAKTIEPSLDDIPVGVLPVDAEILAALDKGGVKTMAQLRRMSLTDLIAVKGIGKTRARKVEDALSAYA